MPLNTSLAAYVSASPDLNLFLKQFALCVLSNICEYYVSCAMYNTCFCSENYYCLAEHFMIYGSQKLFFQGNCYISYKLTTTYFSLVWYLPWIDYVRAAVPLATVPSKCISDID